MAYRIFQKIIAEDTDAPAYPQGKKVIVYKGRFGYSYQELSQLENERQMLSGYIRQLEELDPDIVKSSDQYSAFTAFCAERKLVRESVVSIQNLLKEIKYPDTKVLKLGPTIFVPMTDDVEYEPVVRLNFGC